MRKHQSQPYDKAALDRLTRQTVFDIVRPQAPTGIDFVNNGEMSKSGYSTYVADRLSGFSGHDPAKPRLDTRDHPNFLALSICRIINYILATTSRPKGDGKREVRTVRTEERWKWNARAEAETQHIDESKDHHSAPLYS